MFAWDLTYASFFLGENTHKKECFSEFLDFEMPHGLFECYSHCEFTTGRSLFSSFFQ
jgi:hypothetical protein